MTESTVRSDLVPSEAEKSINSAHAAGVEWVDLGTPVLADVDRIVTVVDPVADVSHTIAAQPDVPRSVTVTITDANDSASGLVTIRGTDIAGDPLVDTFTFGSGVKTFESDNCYATVATIIVSGVAGAAGGDTITCGVGTLIGLPKPIADVAAIKHVWFNGAPVTPTATSAGILAQSGVDHSGGTYDGSKELKVAYRPSL